MIKAKDLRIGNLVNVTMPEHTSISKLCIVDITILGTINRDIPSNGMVFNPIPLTEEWLEKLGFKYSEPLTLWALKNGNTIFDTFDDKGEECAGHYIHFYHDGDHLIVESINDHGEYSNLKFSHIKFVHQVQNLYLDMTGEELTVKEG